MVSLGMDNRPHIKTKGPAPFDVEPFCRPVSACLGSPRAQRLGLLAIGCASTPAYVSGGGRSGWIDTMPLAATDPTAERPLSAYPRVRAERATLDGPAAVGRLSAAPQRLSPP